jgi:hypothetical protein
MRQKRKSRSGRDSFEGALGKTDPPEDSPAPQCQLPRKLAATGDAALERLMSGDQEAEMERLLEDLTTILLAELVTRRGESATSGLNDPFDVLAQKRRRCGEA